MQGGELVQLVGHGRSRSRRRSGGRSLLVCLLLVSLLALRLLRLQIVETGVLLVLVRLPFRLVPGMGLSGHVRAATYRSRAQQRTSAPDHHCLLDIAVLRAVTPSR